MVREAIARAASQEGEDQEAAEMLLARLSAATEERPTDCYTVAALLYEELIGRYESGVAFFGLGQPWDARTPRTHQLWADAPQAGAGTDGPQQREPWMLRLLLPRLPGVGGSADLPQGQSVKHRRRATATITGVTTEAPVVAVLALKGRPGGDADSV